MTRTDTGSNLPRSRGKSTATLELLDAIKKFLPEIQPITVRGICYQCFTRRLIESMAKNETQRVGRILTRAREDETIPWDWIVDETREVERVQTWKDPASILQAVSKQYRKDHWTLQPRQIQVWSEKGTVRGVLRPVLEEFAVDFQVTHGFTSATAVKIIADETADLTRPLIALYVGDWDPSGMWMSEKDLPRRLKEYGGNVDLRRIALNKTDVHDLPSFDAETKAADPRAKWFRAHYGEECWELDALDPRTLRDRVRRAIRAKINWPMWKRCDLGEKAEQASLKSVLDGWNKQRA